LNFLIGESEHRHFEINQETSGLRICLVNLLKLYLDCLFIVLLILDGKKDLAQPFTPGAHISLKGGTVSQYLQNITGLHVRRLYSYKAAFVKGFVKIAPKPEKSMLPPFMRPAWNN